MKCLTSPFKNHRTVKNISLSALSFAESTLDGVPIPGAKVGIGLVLEVIKGIDKSTTNRRILAELENHVRFLTGLLEPLIKMDRLDLSSGLLDEVQSLSKDLETISLDVKSKYSRGSVRRFLDRHEDENELQAFSQNLKSALDRFHLSQTLRQEQESLLRERSALVMTLPRAHEAGYDPGRNDAPLSCLTGTRVDILAEIMAWLESTNGDTPPVYWLNGLAGIGKFTIAKTIADRSAEKGLLGGSFFFSANDDPLRDPQLVIPTLAFQLAQSDKIFMKYIAEALKHDATAGHKKLLPQFERLILIPLLKVLEVDPGHRTIFIVVDALDECGERGAADILRLLFSHATRIPFLRILITSRPEPHISAVFDEAQNHAKTVLHDIEASVVQNDIRLYIHTELAKIPRRLGFLTMPADWATGDEENALVEQSGKLFVYAATSIRFIGDDRVRDPHKHLLLILSAQATHPEELVEAKPYTQLDNLYMGVLRNYFSDSNRQVVLKRFQVVVGSIVLLRQPLPIRSLARFVQSSVDDVYNALHHLRSVIISPPPNIDEPPRIYHPSFLDFITSPSRCTMTDFTIVAVPTQERRHALRCFELMAACLKRDMARIRDPSLLNNEVDGLEQKVNDALSPEAQYACRYWATHLSHVLSGDQAVVRALEEFSAQFVLWWFEAMSLIGSISAAAGYIREAHRWATISKCKTTIVTILSDAHRFILFHAEEIRASALHVYYSALSFTPHDTVLYKAYRQEADTSISVLQGIEDQWLCLSTLRGHSDVVRSVTYSLDGLRLASCSYDHTVRLWDAVSGAHTATLEGHLDKVASVAFSPDGLRLASCSHDRTVRIWDAVSGAHITTLIGHSSAVLSVTFSQDGLRLASCSSDRTVLMWDAASGIQITTLEDHSSEVYSVAFSPDGLRLASCSGNGEVWLWNVVSGAHIATMEGHSNEVYSVAFSPDGLRLASCSADGTVRLWDAISGVHAVTLQGHLDPVYSVTFSPDGSRLASCSDDDTVRLWDAVQGVHIATLEGHSRSVYSVAFSPDGLWLASCAGDGTVRLWEVVSGARSTKLERHSSEVYSVSFSPDGLRLALSSYDRTVRLWDAVSGAHTATLEGRSGLVSSVTFSPDSLQLTVLSDDGTVRLWHTVSGALTLTLEGHSSSLYAIAFSPDGLRLASSSYDCTVWVWHAKSGVHAATLEGHSSLIYSVAFSPDGLRLASCSHDHTVRLWDVVSGAHMATLEGHFDKVANVSFSPDGLRVALCSHGGTVGLWNAVSGIHTVTLEGHSSMVHSAVFAPNGLRLASCSNDGTVRLWDTASGALGATLEGHSGSVYSVAFSPDGLWLASCSHDRTVRVWDTISSTQTTTLEGHSTPVYCAAFSPDGKQLASCSGDGTVQLWDPVSGTRTATMQGYYSRVYSLAFSADARALILTTITRRLIWNLTSQPPSYHVDSTSSPLDRSTPAIGSTPLIRIADRHWIEVFQPRDSQFRRICYIPASYSPTTVEVQMSGHRIAVGCSDGRVIILGTRTLDSVGVGDSEIRTSSRPTGHRSRI